VCIVSFRKFPLVKRVNIFVLSGCEALNFVVQHLLYQYKVQLLKPFRVNCECKIVNIVVDVEL
jgi:hypothetical protein